MLLAEEKKPDIESGSAPSEGSTNDRAIVGEIMDARIDVTAKPKQRFKLWSTLGVAYSVTSAPIAIGTYLSVVIGVGGSPVFFFGYIFTILMDACVCLSLAEMSAVFPHSSGQIYWTAALAPPKKARILSYMVGWWASAGWFCWTAACCLITSQLLFALVEICQATFIAQPWHYYVGYLASALFAVALNIPGFRWYPLFLKGLVVYINLGSLFTLVVLLVRAHPKQSAEYVFVDFVNSTGWSSRGVVFFIGLLPGVTAVNGFDCAAHMAEEMPFPHRQVPQVMVFSAALSALTALIMILVIMFSIVNTENLLDPVGAEPIAQLFVDSLDSQVLTIICMLIFTLTFLFACATIMTSFSRVWWSFAREGGVPFSSWMSRVSRKRLIPVNAIIFSFAACTVIGLLELGSSTSLNAILGAGTVFLFMSYGLAIASSLMTKRQGLVVKHYFDLGHVGGWILNVISVFWVIFITIWLCFPLYVPVTGTTMNYTAVVLAVVNIIAAINWFVHSGKIFKAPTAIDMTFDVDVQ